MSKVRPVNGVFCLAIATFVLLAGCTAGPAPTVTVTATATPTPSVTRSDRSVCDYGPMWKGQMGVIVSAWDLVKASRGESDHVDQMESMQKYIETMQDEESEGCVGSVESAGLVFEIALAKAAAASRGKAPDSYYGNIVTAGNAWFDSINFTDLRFSMKPNDAAA